MVLTELRKRRRGGYRFPGTRSRRTITRGQFLNVSRAKQAKHVPADRHSLLLRPASHFALGSAQDGTPKRKSAAQFAARAAVCAPLSFPLRIGLPTPDCWAPAVLPSLVHPLGACTALNLGSDLRGFRARPCCGHLIQDEPSHPTRREVCAMQLERLNRIKRAGAYSAAL